MSELITPPTPSPDVINGLLHARSKTISAIDLIRNELKEGWDELQCSKKAVDVLKELGALKNWHRPLVRIGSGTLLTFSSPAQTQDVLKEGQPYFIDLGPVFIFPDDQKEYEGDYGDSFIFGQNDSPADAKFAKSCFRTALELAHQNEWTGIEIYRWLAQEIQSAEYLPIKTVNGHRISEFPHHKISKSSLAELVQLPSTHSWVLEIQLINPRTETGTFFEDLLI